MKNLAQVIVLRSDLSFRGGKLIETVAKASRQFLIENNESNDPDKMNVCLTEDESLWLSGSQRTRLLEVDSEDELITLLNRAEIQGLDVYPLFTSLAGEETLLCASFGPLDEKIVDRFLGKLKPFQFSKVQ